MSTDVVERRIKKRESGVACVRRSQAYVLATVRNLPRPRTPDPTDMTLSKRAWEKSMQIWRCALRGILNEIYKADRKVAMSHWETTDGRW